MEFRIFKFRLKKNFADFKELQRGLGKNLEKDTKSFLNKKAKVVDEEEQKREKTRGEKIYELCTLW